MIARSSTDGPSPTRTGRVVKDFIGMFADARFWVWTLMLVGGFAYVAGGLCGRHNPLASFEGGCGDLVKVLISAPLLFFLGPRHNLEPADAGRRRMLLRNGLGYFLCYVAGLQWYWFQRIPNVNYSLKWSDISNMHPAGQAVYLTGTVIILGLGVYHCRWARREGILRPYLSTLLGGILLIVGISWLVRGHYYYHIHHYFFFGYFIPWTRFKNPVSLACQGFSVGVYVEGVSEWGMAPLWYPLN
jgi:hypothetical protein